MRARRRVTIIHPWLPQYRFEFFSALLEQLESEGVELTIAYGAPPADVAGRGDAVSAPWATALPTRFIKMGRRSLSHHASGSVVHGRDLVILEHAIRNLETYPLLLKARRSASRVAFWGHGRTYTKASGVGTARFKAQMTNRAHWFFAYTAGGAADVAESGFPSDRITVVQNSIDTTKLRVAASRTPVARIAELRARHGLTPGKTGLFVGALDTSKRLDFLFQAARSVWLQESRFRLVVAGDGPLRSWVEREAKREPWLRYVGSVFGDDKAALGRTADVLLMPGRVGLVAVDSFALQLPIITTDWPLHAPEFEYLQDGLNARITTDEAPAYASAVASVLAEPRLLQTLRAGCSASSSVYTVEAMVERFKTGVVAAIGA